jgi:UDP:flavonoid glycosyltransferase YjiC (YdhE family)
MKSVIIKVWPALGHLNSTLDLASDIRESGSDVLYIGPPHFKRAVTAQGFEYYIEPSVNGSGSSAKEHYNASVANVIMSLPPSVFLLDVYFSTLGLYLYKRQMLFMYLNVMVATDHFLGMPTVHSSRVLTGGRLNYLCNEIGWRRYYAEHWLRMKLGVRHSLSRISKREAFRMGIPVERLERRRALTARVATVPELFLSPLEFDYPHIPRSGQYYLRSLPYFNRSYIIDVQQEHLMRSHFIEGRRRKTVICSFGTLTHLYRYTKELLSRIIAASSGQDWTLIASVGYNIPISAFKDVPQNVHLFTSIPQVEFLKHGDAMISHGGINSIKECIYLSVPMLIIPGATNSDQQGNGARVRFHRLGIAGRHYDSVACIRASIRRLLSDRRYKLNLMKMREQILDREAKATSAEILSALIGDDKRL